MKKQAGYASARLDDGTFVAILYETAVLTLRGRVVRLAHGGWITPSTRKALNTALEEAGLRGRVAIRQGEMWWDVEGESHCVVEGGIGVPIE